MDREYRDQPGPLGEHVSHSSESIWQPAVLRQQQNSLQQPTSSPPPSLIPLPPSQIYSRRQSGLRSNQVSPSSSELHTDIGWTTDTSAADQAAPSSRQDEQSRTQPEDRQAPSPLFGMNRPLPEIPQWAPPHPAFSTPPQAVNRSITYTADGQVKRVEKPSRSLAVKRRNALLLYEYSRNAAGLPMPGTQRHFKLSANPRQIGQESVGLGVYLTSVIMYMGILFVLALLMIYLTVDNSQQNGYTQTYTSFVNNITSGYCPKTWEVSNSLTKTTAGNFCAGSKYSSMYSCAANCRYSSSQLQQAQCAGLPDKLSYTSGFDVACDEHKVCGEGANATAPNGPCYCCSLELQAGTVDRNQVSPAQMWVLLLGQVIFLVWVMVLRRVQTTAAAQINASVLTAGDYTVYVTGLPRDVTNAELIEYASHYGEVVAAANIIGAGNGLEVGRKLELLTIRGAEAEAERAVSLSGAAAAHPGMVTPGSTAVTQREVAGSGIAMAAGAGIPSEAGSPAQGVPWPGGNLRHPSGPMGTQQMTPQASEGEGSMGASPASTSSRDPLAPYPRSPPPRLYPSAAMSQTMPDTKPVHQVGRGMQGKGKGRRPRWWHGNLFKAFYWACVGQPDTLGRKVDSVRQKLTAIQAKEFRNTGDALITFNYERHAVNCISDHAPSKLQRVCRFIPCVQQGRQHAPKLKGKVISVVRAPEPTDVWWENLSVRGREAWQLRLQSAAITIAVVAAGGVVQFYLAQAGERERLRRLTYEVTYGDASIGFADTYLTAIQLRVISIFAGLFVVFMNFCITLAVRALSFYERWHTHSQREKWHVVKLSVFYLINSFVVPILATNLSGNAAQWYTRGGLIEQAFYIQIANAILPEVTDLLNPFAFLTSHILARYAQTQPMMDLLLAPESFLLSERYASAVKTLGLAIFFMPVLPLSCFIALAGLSPSLLSGCILIVHVDFGVVTIEDAINISIKGRPGCLCISYWGGKYMALRRAQKPSALGNDVTAAINLLVRLLPLVQMILMRHLYFQGHHAEYPVFWTGIAFWLLFALLPSRKAMALVLRKVDQKHAEEARKYTQGGGTGGLAFFDTIYKAATLPASWTAPERELQPSITASPRPLPNQGGLVATVSDLHHEQHTARPELYAPRVPAVCSEDYKMRIASNFSLPERPYPATETLLEGQRHECGGIATRPPPQSPRSLPDSPVIRLSPFGAEAAAYANAGATFGWFNPLPVPAQELV